MDLFTNKANNIVKQLFKEKIIYDSTKEHDESNNNEEDAQTPINSNVTNNALKIAQMDPNNSAKLKSLQSITSRLLAAQQNQEQKQINQINNPNA